MTAPLVAGPIPALVRRHAGDAAFYWAQHDASTHAPLIDLAQLRDFHRLLDAHLDGLWVAADTGWLSAHEALMRHGSAGEVFAAAWLALQGQDAAKLRAVFASVSSEPARRMRGWISALAWVPAELSQSWLHRWLQSAADPCLQVAALRAAAILPVPARAAVVESSYAAWLPALTSQDPRLRASGCRLLARGARVDSLLGHLLDVDACVRAEAAIALAHHAPAKAAPVLWQAIAQLAQRHPALGGWTRFQAERRLTRWVLHLGLLVPPGHPGVPVLLAELPARLGLQFLLAHADPTYLAWIVGLMADPQVGRLAGWVWQVLTGVELQSAGLAVAPQALQADQPPRPTDDLDAGLPLPHPQAVANARVELPDSGRVILGHAWTARRALQVLQVESQPLRWLAAQWLWQVHAIEVSVRAPVAQQTLQLLQLDVDQLDAA